MVRTGGEWSPFEVRAPDEAMHAEFEARNQGKRANNPKFLCSLRFSNAQPEGRCPLKVDFGLSGSVQLFSILLSRPEQFIGEPWPAV
jgi:hypothetical protein